ncbi:MAG: TonB-dependent receptor [Pyrinomonadaceae bacterium]|nr:TonB-dependent receptor [Pyrinomonadaceae bacterium]
MRTTRLIIGLSLTCLLFGPSVMAQTTTSTIEGTVKDANGAVIAGAVVKASGTTLAVERSATTDPEGFYRLAALPAGTYTLTTSQSGFATSTSAIELTLNRVVIFDVQLQVGGNVGAVVTVTSELSLVEPNTTSSGLTVTPRQIVELPVNGRDYLDLLQLVPGVAVNRQADPTGDNANPVLGERSGNNNFFIDGHPNKDTVDGGPAQQFNQETIAEFQVLTTGYKAEFGQASGAIVNVITKSGGNDFHGVGSFFVRNDAFDSTNSLDPTRTEALPLSRYDYSLAGGGRIIKDKFFFFGSAERITERRQLDFTFPDTGSALVNQLLRDQETPFDVPARTSETRAFLKFNQLVGQHQLSQEMNYTNGRVKNFLPLSASSSLPSARNDTGARRLLLAFGDTVLLGDQGNPYILTLRGAYRDEKSDTIPSQTTLGGATIFVPFNDATCTFATCLVLGNLPTVSFGNLRTAQNLEQKYTSFTANVNKLFGNHDLKFGLNFLRTVADGVDARLLQNQLFATTNDFANFDADSAGVRLLADIGGLTPADDQLHLRNNYTALFVQDDWKIRNNLTVNLGLRWDYDSEFVSKKNFAPRLGVAWSVTPETVVRANFGVYYDQFRLGLARNVPSFGGTDQRAVQSLIFPRGFFGSPSFVSSIALLNGLPGGCFSNNLLGNLTDAQITAGNIRCPLVPALPLIGADRLNNVVAAGRSQIPANTVITVNNVQSLTGLTPQQYADQASAAIGQPAGYFVFGASGFLANVIIPPQLRPTTIDGSFETPHTLGFNVGVQRQIGKDMVVEADYFHRDIRDLLGVRSSNLAFESRVLGRRFLPPFTQGAIITYGPFFRGKYDALIIDFNKRFSRRFMFGANYTYADARDNSLGVNNAPSDSFIGIVPEVTEPSTGRSNRDAPFIRANGNLVQQAGTFLNGPDRDKGPSDLSLDHIFQINGLYEFPWQIQVSGIFRAQDGFHFSRVSATLVDPDGDGATNTIDVNAGRNAFTAPAFVNLDVRFSKRFNITERFKAQVLFEFFNLLNRQNPAAVGRQEGVTGQPFGATTQVLPGREGQLGFRLEF